MVAQVGDKVKFHIDFMANGVFIQQGKVCKIKRGLFSTKYLVEVRGLLDINTTKAYWVNKKNILEIIEQK